MRALCICLLLSFAACKKDDNTNADELTPPQEPTVIPPPPEVIRSTAYDTRVAADELILHNGIKLGMSYEEVAAYSEYPGEKPEALTNVNAHPGFSIRWGGITYTFSRYTAEDKHVKFKLSGITVGEGAVDADIFRNIKIGDSVEGVISKLPAEDPVPKMWKEQYLYAYEQIEPKGTAVLRYVMTDVFSNY